MNLRGNGCCNQRSALSVYKTGVYLVFSLPITICCYIDHHAHFWPFGLTALKVKHPNKPSRYSPPRDECDSASKLVVCLCYLLSFIWSSVMCRPQLRPFEFRSRTADVKTEVGANSQPFAALESRTLNDDGSLSVEEAAISILFKLKIFPFRKPSNGSAEDGRNGDVSRDNGAWGAGIDFGLPNGSGFGYGEDASFNTFSFSSVSYIFK